jgi:hypothetical protein
MVRGQSVRLALVKGCRIPSTADDVFADKYNASFSAGLSFIAPW